MSDRSLWDIIDDSASNEEAELFDGGFVMRCGKALKILLPIAAALMLFIWLITKKLDPENDVRFLFIGFAVLILLFLPSVFSYKCTVTKESMTESTLIVFIKYQRTVLWCDVKYKKITSGQNESVVFYNADKKRLISFDKGLVGYGRILKIAKKNSIKNLK